MRRLLLPAFLWLLAVVAVTCARGATATVGGTSVTVTQTGSSSVGISWTVTSGMGVAVYPSNGPGLENSGPSYWTTATVGSGSTSLTGIPGAPGVYLYLFATDGIPGGSIGEAYIYLDGDKKVKISIRNTKAFPVTYLIKDDSGTTVFSTVLAANTGLIQVVSVPAGTPLPLHVVALYDDLVWNPVTETWAFEEGEVTTFEGEAIVINDEPDGDLEIVPEDEPDPPTNVIDEPAGPSGRPGDAKEDSAIWRSDESPEDLLDKATFREGTNKVVQKLDAIKKGIDGTNTRLDAIKEALEGGEEAEVPEDGELPDAADRPTVTSMIPAAPTVFSGSFSNVHVIGFTSPAITVAGKTFPSKTLSIDLANYSVSIGIMRALLSCVIWVLFFVLVVKTIRGAGAGS